jgi:hypothetical protein
VEYSAECPECGDTGHIDGTGIPDRFRMRTDGSPRGFCRSCKFFEFANQNGKKLTPAELIAIKEARIEIANEERERVRRKVARLEELAEWKGWHDAMEEAHRDLWRQAGIDDKAQDWWELGYNAELIYTFGDETKVSPALTIPYWRKSKVVNVQSRLLNPANPADKYRWRRGLPAVPFLPDKDSLPEGATLIVEGAKKGMVSWLWFGDLYTIVAIPSKNLSHKHVALFDNCEPIVICLDPDAGKQAVEAAKMLGTDRARVAALPTKIDDAIVIYKADHRDIRRSLDQARRVA